MLNPLRWLDRRINLLIQQDHDRRDAEHRARMKAMHEALDRGALRGTNIHTVLLDDVGDRPAPTRPRKPMARERLARLFSRKRTTTARARHHSDSVQTDPPPQPSKWGDPSWVPLDSWRPHGGGSDQPDPDFITPNESRADIRGSHVENAHIRAVVADMKRRGQL